MYHRKGFMLPAGLKGKKEWDQVRLIPEYRPNRLSDLCQLELSPGEIEHYQNQAVTLAAEEEILRYYVTSHLS